MTEHNRDSGMNQDRLHEIAQKVAKLRPTSSHSVRTAGKIEFVKDSGPVRRDIRIDGFKWTSDNLKNLAKILWAAQRSHGYAIAAYRLFSKMPSSGFSPDGLLGGRGYIQAVKDMRQALAAAVETMSSFTDTIHDEINAEHWKQAADEQISEMVQDAENVKANPEEFVEGEFTDDDQQSFDPGSQLSEAMDESGEPIANPSPDDFDEGFTSDEDESDDEDEDDGDPFSQIATESFADAKDLKKFKHPEPEEPASQLPAGAGEQDFGKTVSEMVMKTTSSSKVGYASAVSQILKAYEIHHKARTAGNREPLSFEEFVDRLIMAGGDSSIPVETLPGPRILHVGPGQSGTESGGYGDSFGSDDPAGEGLPSGTNMSQPLYEDWTMDGVTGDDNPTDGDQTVLKISRHTAALPIQDGYSWLPGSENERNLNYYELGLSEADVDWMRQHAAPTLPPGIKSPDRKIDSKDLWDVVL